MKQSAKRENMICVGMIVMACILMPIAMMMDTPRCVFAQVTDLFGSLQTIHKRIAKQDTDVYINALADTIKTSDAFKDAAARKLFTDDFNAALGIGYLANKPNVEELKKALDVIDAGPWTAESKALAKAELMKMIPVAVEVEAESVVEVGP